MALDINDIYNSKSSNALTSGISQENQSSGKSLSAPAGSLQQSRSGVIPDEATTVSLSAFDSTRTGFLTESDIVNGLNASLNSSGVQAPNANSNDFSPQAVADRILEQVSSLIEQFAGSPEQANEMLQQARKGIANGLSQARETLNALGALNDGTKNTLNDTGSLIEKGLRALEESLLARFERPGVLEEQKQPQPQGERQVMQTQNAQIVQGASLAQAQAGAEKRVR